ncbi:ISAzo13-like element transposase-related protein [Methanosarcina spelaei]
MKHNPIEHGLFCHVTAICKGTILSSLNVIKSLVDKTST